MGLLYDDIYLIPQKSIVSSRDHCDTSVKLGQFKFVSPVYPANMKSVVNEETCIYMAERNWFYTMHRFGVDNFEFIKKMKNLELFTSISIGVNGNSKEVIEKLHKNKMFPDFITIDVANAWSNQVEDMVELIKSRLYKSFLIVGNVATKEAVLAIEDWGVDAIKVGIAGGSPCTTRLKTGFQYPMASSVEQCCEVASVPIIADGGVKHHGDIAKAIVLGADMVMAGSLFAGYDQSAGDLFEFDGHNYKEYFGSASEYNKKEKKNIEGRKVPIEYKGSMDRLLEEVVEDLSSSISYAGGKDLSILKSCPWNIVGTR